MSQGHLKPFPRVTSAQPHSPQHTLKSQERPRMEARPSRRWAGEPLRVVWTQRWPSTLQSVPDALKDRNYCFYFRHWA